MSDSFANLWSSSAPTKPAGPARTLGGALGSSQSNSNSAGARRPQYDAFSILAPSKPAAYSAPNTRSQAPSTTSPSAPGSITTAASQSASNGSGDSFSGLLSGTFSGVSSDAKLSIAARAAKAEAERRAAFARQQQQTSKQQTSAWVGLDALGSENFIAPQVPQRTPSPPPDDDWLFGKLAPKQSTSQPAAPASVPASNQNGDWGLEEFISRPASSRPAPLSSSSKPRTVWDLDNFESTPSAPSSRGTPIRSGTPGDFDFGDREDGLLDGDSENENEILGALGKPVGANSRRTPLQDPHPSSTRRPRSSSPPPHLIGQMIEMGYSIEQARTALAATDTGEDVQAAVEILISGGMDSDVAPTSRVQRPSREDDGWGERAPRRRFDYDDGDDDTRNHQHHREDTHTASRPPIQRGNSSQRELNTSEGYQQQADKLLAQASEIGLNVFNRANALWKQGKEQAKKAYEERATSINASRTSSAASRAGGQPRWMQAALAKDEEEQRAQRRQSTQPFADDDGSSPPAPGKQGTRSQTKSDSPSQPISPPTGDLFADEAPKAYKSPYRRGREPAVSPPQAPMLTSKASAPVVLVQRQTISASASAIASSSSYKANGTEMYKLGRYADADAAYTTALSQLPDGHLLAIPLLNNRAVSRLKTGDTNGAVDDCTTVIGMIGASYHPAREARVAQEDHGSSVNLADALVKAWRRRAEAYEAREKWDSARHDWEAIIGVDFAGAARKDAITGAARCRQAADATRQTKPVVSKAKPTRSAARPPPRRRPTPPSEALDRLKQANAEAEAEDQAKYELKDSVDARLAAWKTSKETNIRALISSLETVLWPELGWQKVSMAELLTPHQVKIRYTKAIAKLHPDKLNARNTTIEQRMIANGVFGSLNDAWNAFQSSG